MTLKLLSGNWQKMALIREYKDSDRSGLLKLVEQLQDYLVEIDELKRLRRLPEFGETFTKKCLDEVREKEGMLYVVEGKGELVGFIAGVVEEISREGLMTCIPAKFGWVTELFVQPEYQHQGIGKQLMEKMEAYFKQKGCDTIKTSVFVPNKIAYQFYQDLGFLDREVELIKKL